MPRFVSLPSIGRPRFAGCLAVAGPLLLAGLLPLRPEVSGRWGWSGNWVYPVGDPYGLSAAPVDGEPPYRVMRGLSERDGSGSGHQGVDLSNGRAGGPVRAAGNGLVVAVGGKGWNHGYGRHVVLAHRFVDGALVYSLYAHLAAGSVTVRPGQAVSAGLVVGRVGMTGRATSPHLHFEVRVPEDPAARWENVAVVDPVAFVARRRPPPPADSSWASSYIEWAESAALIRPGERGDRSMSRLEWWRALAVASRDLSAPIPANAESLRATLIEAHVLPDDDHDEPGAPLGWSELARDLRHVRGQGLRLPWSPVDRATRRQDCQRELGVDSPARHPQALAERNDGRPSRAAACLGLADIAGDPPSRPKAPARRPALASRAG